MVLLGNISDFTSKRLACGECSLHRLGVRFLYGRLKDRSEIRLPENSETLITVAEGALYQPHNKGIGFLGDCHWSER